MFYYILSALYFAAAQENSTWRSRESITHPGVYGRTTSHLQSWLWSFSSSLTSSSDSFI